METASQKMILTNQRKCLGKKKHELSFSKTSMSSAKKMMSQKPPQRKRAVSMTTTLITKWTQLGKWCRRHLTTRRNLFRAKICLMICEAYMFTNSTELIII